jgi:hypothetical protein
VKTVSAVAPLDTTADSKKTAMEAVTAVLHVSLADCARVRVNCFIFGAPCELQGLMKLAPESTLHQFLTCVY